MGKLPRSAIRAISARFKAGGYDLELGVFKYVNKANLHTGSKRNGRRPLFQQLLKVVTPLGDVYYLGEINNQYVKLIKSNGRFEPTDKVFSPDVVQNILNNPKFQVSIISSW